MEVIKKRWWAFALMVAVLAGQLLVGSWIPAMYSVVLIYYLYLNFGLLDLNAKLLDQRGDIFEKNEAMHRENKMLIGENVFIKKMLSRRESGVIVLLGNAKACKEVVGASLEPERFIAVSNDTDTVKLRRREIDLVIRLYGAKEIEERHPWVREFIERRRTRE